MVKYTELGNAPDINLNKPPANVLPMGTVPVDPRFPNTNQTKYCYTSYLDFHRCKNRHSEEHEACKYFKRVYTTMCPNSWIEKWDEQVETGTFPGNIK